MSSTMVILPRNAFESKNTESINFKEMSMIFETLKLLNLAGLFHNPPVWRRLLCAPLIGLCLIGQYYHVLTTDLTIYALVLQSYLLVLWSNSFARAFIMAYKHQKYLQIIDDIKDIYQDLKVNKNCSFSNNF